MVKKTSKKSLSARAQEAADFAAEKKALTIRRDSKWGELVQASPAKKLPRGGTTILYECKDLSIRLADGKPYQLELEDKDGSFLYLVEHPEHYARKRIEALASSINSISYFKTQSRKLNAEYTGDNKDNRDEEGDLVDITKDDVPDVSGFADTSTFGMEVDEPGDGNEGSGIDLFEAAENLLDGKDF
jgi:hypothetical protein